MHFNEVCVAGLATELTTSIFIKLELIFINLLCFSIIQNSKIIIVNSNFTVFFAIDVYASWFG